MTRSKTNLKNMSWRRVRKRDLGVKVSVNKKDLKTSLLRRV